MMIWIVVTLGMPFCLTAVRTSRPVTRIASSETAPSSSRGGTRNQRATGTTVNSGATSQKLYCQVAYAANVPATMVNRALPTFSEAIVIPTGVSVRSGKTCVKMVNRSGLNSAVAKPKAIVSKNNNSELGAIVTATTATVERAVLNTSMFRSPYRSPNTPPGKLAEGVGRSQRRDHPARHRQRHPELRLEVRNEYGKATRTPIERNQPR